MAVVLDSNLKDAGDAGPELDGPQDHGGALRVAAALPVRADHRIAAGKLDAPDDLRAGGDLPQLLENAAMDSGDGDTGLAGDLGERQPLEPQLDPPLPPIR